MELSNYTAKFNSKKKEFAGKIKELKENYSVVGVVDVTSLPAPQFQQIRSKLRGRAEVLMVKKRVIKKVFDELESKFTGIKDLGVKIDGICGLIFTNENPFKIYKFIQKSKTQAPAKGGSVAPKDILVPAGPTNFAPGPIIGELGALKIKAGIDAGKVAIKEDAIVAKEGEEISGKLAEILTRLDIKPMEVGLNIKGIFDAGVIYERSILDVDEDYYLNMIKSASSQTFALSIGLNYYTSENIKHFVGKSYRDTVALALGVDYISDETIDKMIGKSYAQAAGLAQSLPEDLRPEEVGSVNSNAVANESSSEQSQSKSSEESEVKKDDEGDSNPAAGLGSLFG